MCTSNSLKENEDNALPEWREPFPEPRTIPLGWNLTGSLLELEPVTSEEVERKIED